MGRRARGRVGGRRRRRGRRQRHLRPPRLDAGLHPRRPRTVPQDRRGGRLPGPSSRVPHGARDLRLRRPGQGPVLPRRLRLLRAHPHHRRHPRGGVRDPGPRDAREGALDPRRPDVPAVGGQVRQLPVRGRARGDRGPQGRPDLLDGRRGGDGGHRRPARRRARDPDLGRGRRGTRLVQARLDRGRSQAPRPGQRVEHARRDLGGARRRDHAARRLRGSRTSRRSISSPSPCRCSRS